MYASDERVQQLMNKIIMQKQYDNPTILPSQYYHSS
jgi:hypothetical protein